MLSFIALSSAKSQTDIQGVENLGGSCLNTLGLDFSTTVKDKVKKIGALYSK